MNLKTIIATAGILLGTGALKAQDMNVYEPKQFGEPKRYLPRGMVSAMNNRDYSLDEIDFDLKYWKKTSIKSGDTVELRHGNSYVFEWIINLNEWYDGGVPRMSYRPKPPLCEAPFAYDKTIMGECNPLNPTRYELFTKEEDGEIGFLRIMFDRVTKVGEKDFTTLEFGSEGKSFGKVILKDKPCE